MKLSIRPVIHPWMTSYREENPGRNKYPPPSAHVSLSRKGMPSPGGGTPNILILISARNPTYISHGQLYVTISQVTSTANIKIFSSDLFPWSAVCYYLTGHKHCKHQDFQLRSFPMVSCMLLSRGSQAVQTSRFSAVLMARVLMDTCKMCYIERS